MKKLLLVITILFAFSGLSTQVYSSEKISTNYSKVIDGGRCQATTKKGTQCKRNAAEGSDYCWQHGGTKKTSYNNKKDYNKSEKSNNNKAKIEKTSTGETYNGKIVHTGPRGGKYYINKNGNKTYIKRK